RTFLAQVFAQDPQILILDEPANHLDLIYQKQVLELVSRWIREKNRSVISVVHDLSLVKAFGTDVLLLSGGKTVAFGKADEVLRDENLDKAYGMPVRDWMRSLLSQWE
ncbi:MAG: ABC transporter ATP-binding protein, partial [Clostridia bacterium]|nr:ABC transporter ATP-binding protein [Clostridia bacterium]